MQKLVDVALNAGRQWQSPQTGLIHYCHYDAASKRQDMVPTYENFLFVLALLRSHALDHLEEAKRLIEKLLAYQSSSGNFPVHLHEYPNCYDRWHAATLLLPLRLILQEGSSILGKDCARQLRRSAKALLSHCRRTLTSNPADYPTALKIAAGTKALGGRQVAREGGEELFLLAELGTQPSWFVSQTLGEIFVTLQMAYPSLLKSPWLPFLKHFKGLWYAPLQCYGGPAYNEHQWGAEPIASLYDFVMASQMGQSPRQSGLPRDLEAVLVQPIQEPFSQPCPGTLQGGGLGQWERYFSSEYAYAVIKQEDTLVPFRFLWGSQQAIRSLACEGGNHRLVEVTTAPGHIEFLLDLGPLDARKDQEIAFYCSRSDKIQLRVNGEQATVFHLKDQVTIQEKNLHLNLSFSLEEGEGEFMGHLMPGNRPSQLDSLFPAYDWQVFLRTVWRSELCKIRVTLDVDDATLS